MKNKQLLIIGLFFITFSTIANPDQIFAPYDKTDQTADVIYKMFLNVTLNFFNELIQSPLKIGIPVATHVTAYAFDKYVIKKPEYKAETLKVEGMQNDLNTKKELNAIKIKEANTKLIESSINAALQLQKTIITNIKNDPDLSEEERAEKIKTEKAELEKMQKRFVNRISEKVMEGSSIKENPAILPVSNSSKKQEQNLPTQPENTTISAPTTEVNQTPAPNPTPNNEQPTAPVQTEIPVANPTAAV